MTKSSQNGKISIHFGNPIAFPEDLVELVEAESLISVTVTDQSSPLTQITNWKLMSHDPSDMIFSINYTDPI